MKRRQRESSCSAECVNAALPPLNFDLVHSSRAESAEHQLTAAVLRQDASETTSGFRQSAGTSRRLRPGLDCLRGRHRDYVQVLDSLRGRLRDYVQVLDSLRGRLRDYVQVLDSLRGRLRDYIQVLDSLRDVTETTSRVFKCRSATAVFGKRQSERQQKFNSYSVRRKLKRLWDDAAFMCSLPSGL
ncbi:hypothetical protein GBF38_015927 [Nibea albiflora]|uniref:Uncharacterized protein n=1 Tax=Nibea albiflora TaxID=240163 RepID=A0ACB7FHM9_NIBAL|nr:hypothetical protein GBF38_015927 [Nibea albiflora]